MFLLAGLVLIACATIIANAATGNVEWQGNYGIGNSRGYAVQQAADGGYAVAGMADSVSNGSQIYMVKTDARGAMKWQNTYGGAGDDRGYSVGQAADGGYILAGESNSLSADSRAYLVKVYNDTAIVPVAGFKPNSTGGMAPLTMQFTDASTGSPTSWLWSFGDGTANVTTRNATHTFEKPGTYNVQLTASNGTVTSTASQKIEVKFTRIIVDPQPGAGMFTNISSAIAYASPGDKIFVNSGYYRESLIVDKPVELAGLDTGGGMPVVDGSGSDNAIKVLADGASLHGFGVTGSYNGIIVASKHVNVSNNHVYNNTYAGIEIYRYGENKVRGNTIDNNGNGIYIYNSKGNSIADNKARNCYVGITLEGSSDNTISGNTAGGNDHYGIYAYNSSGNVLWSNSMLNNRRNALARGGANSWNCTSGSQCPGYIGNYWDDYTGNDSNGDGIGDTPYMLNSKNVDMYPLIAPLNVLHE